MKEPVNYVNPFIGTSGGPEAGFTDDLLKNGRFNKLIKQQKLRAPVSAGGYNWDASWLKGFSLTRLSGSGRLGAKPINLLLMLLPASGWSYQSDNKLSPGREFIVRLKRS